ncbi:tRNA modification GTPase [Parvularcula bermudensis HTCC2503]|uniref:tRNA modification GTPase MnmE n=2 Tax=Parvularcula TaxID=208215 RepID=E0TES7_PARBH|nr:tRNA modification GTPase [Parvularcula bermudensis HTCC2503]
MGKAGIAVWRLSGPASGEILDRLSGGRPRPQARRATHRYLVTPEGALLDDGLVLWFPGPASATGEDMVELHLHGSLAVARALPPILSNLGARAAMPGEFTLRGFHHGKMSLLAVEGLAALLDSETEAQRRQAMRTLSGEGSAQVARWRAHLLRARAVLESAIDFPDEEDIPAQIAEEVRPALVALYGELQTALAEAKDARRLREGIEVAIIGPPNAGKSTLLNALLKEDRALVSSLPGTTRDIVSARLEIGGRVVEILDTAGIREATTDDIERAGVERSRDAAARADLVIACSPAGAPPPAIDTDAQILAVATKADEGRAASDPRLAISVHSGANWDRFLTAFTEAVLALGGGGLFAYERQRLLIGEAATAVERILAADLADPELLAEQVRAIGHTLDALTGKIGTEDILGEIFSAFCIGK